MLFSNKLLRCFLSILLIVALFSGCTPQHQADAPSDILIVPAEPTQPLSPTAIDAILDWLPGILAELGYPGTFTISQQNTFWICKNDSSDPDGMLTIQIYPYGDNPDEGASCNITTPQGTLSDAALDRLCKLTIALGQRFYENAKPVMMSEMFACKFVHGKRYNDPGRDWFPYAQPSRSHYIFESYDSSESEFCVEYVIKDATQYGTVLSLITCNDGSRELQIHAPTSPETFEGTSFQQIQQSVTDSLAQAGLPLACYIQKNDYDLDFVLYYTGEGEDDYSPYISISITSSDQTCISSLNIETEEGASESSMNAARLIFSAIAPYCNSAFTQEYMDAFYALHNHVIVSGEYGQYNRYGAVSDGEYTDHDIGGDSIGMQIYDDRSYYYINVADKAGISTASISKFLEQMITNYDIRLHIADGVYYSLKESDAAAISTPEFAEYIEQLLGYPLEEGIRYRTEYPFIILSDDVDCPYIEGTITTRMADQSIEAVSASFAPQSAELRSKDVNWFHQVVENMMAYCDQDTGKQIYAAKLNSVSENICWDFGNVVVNYTPNYYDFRNNKYERQIDWKFNLSPLPVSENQFTTIDVYNGASSTNGNYFNLPGLSDITALLNAYYAEADVPVTLCYRETEGGHTDYSMDYEGFGTLPTSHFTLRVNQRDDRPYNFLMTYVDELSDFFELEEGYYYYGMTPGTMQQLPIALCLLADSNMTVQEAQQLFAHMLTPELSYPLDDSGAEVTITSYSKADVIHILSRYSSGNCAYEVMTRTFFDEHYGDLYTFAQTYFG